MKQLLLTFLSIATLTEQTRAETLHEESTRDFAECRAMLQAYAGAFSGKLATYKVETAEKLESTFRGTDGTVFTITCLAKERKMIILKER